jgi:t-SNARE complex subunit (syntaxin)
MPSYLSINDGEEEDRPLTDKTPLVESFRISDENIVAKTGKGFLGTMLFALNYVNMDTKKRLGSFSIGLLTIIIVVFVVSILYNSVQKAPIVFLKLAEDQAGAYF